MRTIPSLPTLSSLVTFFAMVISFAVAVLLLPAPSAWSENEDEKAAAAAQLEFAVVGDYGEDNDHTRRVADMVVNGWAPDLILTVGDNNYISHRCVGYKHTSDKYYCRYMAHAPSCENNRAEDWDGKPCRWTQKGQSNGFFPVPGNHEFDKNNHEHYNAYRDHFHLGPEVTGNKLTVYYFDRYNVRFIGINSNCICQDEQHGGPKHCPGLLKTKNQYTALYIAEIEALLKGRGPRPPMPEEPPKWNVVFSHEPAFNSSSNHGPSCPQVRKIADAILKKGFQKNTIMLAGHEHNFQRNLVSVNGEQSLFIIAGQSTRDQPGKSHDGSSKCCDLFDPKVMKSSCYNDHPGALRVTVSDHEMVLDYYYKKEGHEPYKLDSCTMTQDSPPICEPSEQLVTCRGS